MALLIRGKLKGETVQLHQWCNDWFMLSTYDIVSPMSLKLDEEEIQRVRNCKSNGILFTLFELLGDGTFVRRIRTRSKHNNRKVKQMGRDLDDNVIPALFNRSKKTVVAIVSGGMDSAVLVARLLDQGYNVKALSVDYGQRHKKELQYAAKLCEHYSIEHRVADLTSITPLLAGSSQTDSSVDVPEGHYASESMKLTVVPNRNAIMFSIAAGWAISLKANHVAYGAHGGDHPIYPDCRPEFVEALSKAFQLADWHQVSIIAPFITWTKADITVEGSGLSVPFEMTWSCYQGGDIHCGKCGTCVERRAAFVGAGVGDPTEYACTWEETTQTAGITLPPSNGDREYQLH